MVDRVPFCDVEEVNTDPRMIEAYLAHEAAEQAYEKHGQECKTCPWVPLMAETDYQYWLRTGRKGPEPDRYKERCDEGERLYKACRATSIHMTQKVLPEIHRERMAKYGW